MTNPIKATWCISNNIGDALTPWLIEKITGAMPLYVPYEVMTPKYMVSGSILNHAVQYTTVWGAGIANENDNINSSVDIRAVRGPLTARRVRFHAGIDVKIVGDPAWLMPRFERRNDGMIGNYKVGIVPHYAHQAEVAQWIGDRTDIKLINVFNAPGDFLTDLCRCDVIYSSSLHGLIIADAYGIPSQWIDCTAKLGGDGFKFYDHLYLRDLLTKTEDLLKVNSVIQCNPEHISIELEEPVARLHLQQLPTDIDKLRDAIADKTMPSKIAVKALCDLLWSVCPFKPGGPDPVKPKEEVEKQNGKAKTVDTDTDDTGENGKAGTPDGSAEAPASG